MWFKKKKISTTVRNMQRLSEMNQCHDSKIKELRKHLSLLCPSSGYAYSSYSNPLLAEAINEKISRIEKEKLELEI